MRKPKTTTPGESYVEQLEEWLRSEEGGGRRQGGDVAFLALRGDVEAAIDRGYSLKTVYRHLHASGRYPHRYETFLKHAAKHMDRTGTARSRAGAPRSPRAPVKATGFNFTATPDQEDLI